MSGNKIVEGAKDALSGHIGRTYLIGVDLARGKDTEARVQYRFDNAGRMHVERAFTVHAGGKVSTTNTIP